MVSKDGGLEGFGSPLLCRRSIDRIKNRPAGSGRDASGI